MRRVKSFDEFVNENLKAAIGSPIKYTKIKNNLKKFQQTKVQQSLNNVDFEKKKQKGTLDPKAKDTLAAANKAKNQALADKGSAIQQRMSDLATSEPLKKVVTIGTTKAKVAAAETALKAADAEETKQLKVRIAKLNQKAAKETQALKDYASTEKPKEEKPKVQQQNLDNVPKAEKPKVEKPKAADAKETPPTEEQPKDMSPAKATADAGGKEDPGAKIEADIKAYNDNIEAERATMSKAMKDLEQAKRDLKTGRGSEDKVQKIEKAIEDSKEDIAELKKKEADAKKKLQSMQKESVTEDRSSEIEKMIKDKAKPKTLVPKAGLPPSVGEELKEAHAGETMTDKFRRLMAKHNVQSS